MQIVLHSVWQNYFFQFSDLTYIIVGLAWVAFMTGTIMIDFLSNDGRPATSCASLQERLARDAALAQLLRFVPVFPALYAIVVGLFAYLLYGKLNGLGVNWSNPPEIRQLVVEDFANDRDLYAYFRVFHLGVGVCIFLLTASQYLSRRMIALLMFMGLLTAIATTGRLHLMLFCLSAMAVLHQLEIITWRGLLAGAAGFFGLFFLVALLLGKGDGEGLNSALEGILWNFQVYFMSSVACFNDFVETRNQVMDGGALLPNAVREVIGFFGIAIPPKLPLLPFSEVPLPCNTYTFLYPLFHDGGLVGVAAGALVIGGGHQYLYRKFRLTDSLAWRYIYAISTYALFMTIFEDAYFSSPGFWLILLTPPMAYLAFQRLAKNIG